MFRSRSSRGEYLAIMGPSGSGKSTLLNLLGALDRPPAETSSFEGQSLGSGLTSISFRASTFGFVFQSFYLLPTLTAVENVQIPDVRIVARTAASARKRRPSCWTLVGMSHRAEHLPAKLSVGERQRVAIARALANDPKLLLADEPTGNLDSASGNIVLDLFDRLHRERGLTLVVITHDAHVAARAQRTVWIRDGRHSEFVIARERASCDCGHCAARISGGGRAVAADGFRTGDRRGRGRRTGWRFRIAGKLVSRSVHAARRRSGRAAAGRGGATVEGHQARIRRSRCAQIPGVREVIGRLMDMVAFEDKDLFMVIVNGWEPIARCFDRVQSADGPSSAGGRWAGRHAGTHSGGESRQENGRSCASSTARILRSSACSKALACTKTARFSCCSTSCNGKWIGRAK